MQTYYFTFGQSHVHPETGKSLKDYWIEIKAPSRAAAIAVMDGRFRGAWANCYTKEEFAFKYFPGKCLVTVELSEEF